MLRNEMFYDKKHYNTLKDLSTNDFYAGVRTNSCSENKKKSFSPSAFNSGFHFQHKERKMQMLCMEIVQTFL